LRSDPEARCVLCIEDDDATRLLIAAALRDFSVEFAVDGHAAVIRYSAAAFDAFVVDVRLPDYNGLSICRDIRRLDPHVPIIVWTALEVSEVRERATDAGATTYLQKSDRYDLLRAALSDAVSAADRRLDSARAQADAELAAVLGSSSPSPSRPAAWDVRIRQPVCNKFLQSGGTLAQFERWWVERTR
jgi:CheY-like chemotaxis protein